jgi:hypothetical protein
VFRADDASVSKEYEDGPSRIPPYR